MVEPFEPNQAAAAFESVAIAGMIHKNPPHRLGRRGEEMAATVEMLIANQPQVGLVDKCGGIEGMAAASADIFEAASLRNSS